MPEIELITDDEQVNQDVDNQTNELGTPESSRTEEPGDKSIPESHDDGSSNTEEVAKPEQNTDVPDYNSWLSESTSGQVSSLEALQELIEENNQLRSSNPDNALPNEKAKQAYAFATKFGEGNIQDFQKYASLQAMDVENLDGKTAMIEKLMLSEKGMTREFATEIVEDRIMKDFAEGEEDDMSATQKWNYQKEVREAKEFLSNTKQEFEAPAEDDQQVAEQQAREELESNLQQEIKNFNGISYHLAQDENGNVVVKPGDGEDPAKTFKFSFDQNQSKGLLDSILQPTEFYKNQFFTENGDLNTQGLLADAFMRQNTSQFVQQLIDFGRESAKIDFLKDEKNISGNQPGTFGESTPNQKKSRIELLD